jgi:hypothetical protein
MPEFGTSGLMSGEGKRGDAAWPKPPRLSSTLPESLHDLVRLRTRLFALMQAHDLVASYQETRETVGFFELRGQRRIDLGGPQGDAAWVTRCGGACQAGEARASAAAARRLAAQPQVSAAGHADAIATLMRRTLTRTRAPILSSLRRMVPQVALANGV